MGRAGIPKPEFTTGLGIYSLPLVVEKSWVGTKGELGKLLTFYGK